jgi:hypothetical protein
MAPWSRQSLDNAPNYAVAPRSGNNSQNSRALNRIGSWRWRSFRGRIPSMTVRDFTNLQWFDTDSMHDLLIEGTAWDVVVLQDQSFRPLPAMITVNGKSVVTRGDFEGFESV